MSPVSPGVFTLDFAKTGNRQAAVINQDNTINGPNNRAARGSVISIYATGQGLVPGAPADGVQPTTLLTTPFTPKILINAVAVDAYQRGNLDPPADQWIQFSGLSQYPGLWQINVHVPTNVVTGSATLHVVAGSFASNDTSSGYSTIIWVK